MNYRNGLAILILAFFSTVPVSFTQISFTRGYCEDYVLGPDSNPQEGVPRGEIKGPFLWAESKIYPGTERRYWIYVPASYDAEKASCVMVLQDGLGRAKGWRVPQVFDNLIHKKEMPSTIGIFIEPGVVPAPNSEAQSRFNRSFEYDALGDSYVRFLLEEIFPEVAKSYNLSKDPNDRAIAGASSGAICAFTAAWERPDSFRRVFSTIGTYVGLRGGNVYPILIRKTEPKPIRIFLQDGNKDLDIYGGSWWVANQDMLSALKFAGYDVKHAWGTQGHSGKHGAAIFPDAMRWLWRDYPEPIKVNRSSARRTDILIPGESWELVSEGHKFTEGPAVNSKGEIFFTDIPNGRIHRVNLEGKVSVFVDDSPGVNGLMFDKDDTLIACQNGSKRIVTYDAEGHEKDSVEDAPCNDLVVLRRGGYFTDPNNKKVWHVDSDGQKRVVDEGIEFPNGVITSADQSLLFVSDTRGRFIYSFQIQEDGTLKHRQKFGWIHLGDQDSDSGADGMTVDTQGRLYLTTRMGLQIFDQLGRCHLILPRPQRKWLSNVVFGGPELNILYVTCGDKVYRRKVKAKGVVPSRGPVKPPRPRL